MNTEPLPARVAAPPAAPRPYWNAVIAFVGAAAVVLLAFGAAALIRAASFGERMASAEAMPPETQLYIDIDFASLDDLDRLLGAFDTAFADAGLEPNLDTLIDRIDAELQAELEIGVDDITPWVGRDLGIGLLGIAGAAPSSALVPSLLPDVIVAISVRDAAGADDFVTDMVTRIETMEGVGFGQRTYREVRLNVSDDEVSGSRLVVGRSGDLLLIGSSEDVVRRAIDAQTGESLADDGTLNETLDMLPGGRAATVYVAGSLFDDVAAMLGSLGPAPEANTLRSLAASAALTADGVRIDYAVLVDERAGVPPTDQLAGAARIPADMPAGTFIFFGADAGTAVEGFDLDDALAGIYGGGNPLAQVVAELERELGLDLQNDLIELLSGTFGVGVFESSTPLLGRPDLPAVGLSGLIGTTDPAAMQGTVAKIAGALGVTGLVVEPRQIAGNAMYAVAEGGRDIALFGVAGDYLVAASGTDAIDSIGDGGRSLADDPLFTRASDALGSAQPAFFLDLGTALRVFDAPSDMQRYLEPVRGMIAGGEGVPGGFRFTLLTLIDY